MRNTAQLKRELCYILLVALVFLNPFYRDTTLHVTTLLSNYSRSVNMLHISARAGHPRGGLAGARATISNGAKNLDEGASPLLIIHLLIQYLLLLQTMIPNSQLIFLPSAKRGLRKNSVIDAQLA